MQHRAYGLIVLLTLTAMPLSAGAAPARADRQANCVASVDAIRLNGGISHIRAHLRRHSASLPETDAGWLARR